MPKRDGPRDNHLWFDNHTGDRWWGTDHVHRRLPDEPLNYTGWHEWAKRRKVRQRPCSTPGCPILRWADEKEDPDE